MAAVLQDLSIVSVLLIIGFILRKKVPLFQKYFIPAAMIGGFLGLLAGPQILGNVTSVTLPIGQGISQMPGILINIVMTLTFLGAPKRDKKKKERKYTIAAIGSGITYHAQLFAGLVVAYIMMQFFDLPIGFGLTGVFGFFSGHGTAAATGANFVELGWQNAIGVATTIATAGMLSGIILGMLFNNIAIRKKQTSNSFSGVAISSVEKKGYVPVADRKPIGFGVTFPDSLDPLAMQVALCLLAYGGGILIRNGLILIHSELAKVPLFATCMLSGIIMNAIMHKLGLHDYLDKPTLSRISGLVLDVLVCSAIATTPIQVFTDYWLPIVALTVVLVLVNIVTNLYIGYKTYEENWFERSIGAYGTFSGVLATGLLLVRTVDPEFKTDAPQTASFAAASAYPYMLTYIALGPTLSYKLSPLLMIGWAFAITIVLFAIMRMKFWKKERRIPEH